MLDNTKYYNVCIHLISVSAYPDHKGGGGIWFGLEPIPEATRQGTHPHAYRNLLYSRRVKLSCLVPLCTATIHTVTYPAAWWLRLATLHSQQSTLVSLACSTEAFHWHLSSVAFCRVQFRQFLCKSHETVVLTVPKVSLRVKRSG